MGHVANVNRVRSFCPRVSHYKRLQGSHKHFQIYAFYTFKKITIDSFSKMANPPQKLKLKLYPRKFISL